eukprot:TRINITY_DN1778_c0_g1_i1.p1 TRINITY_DN1778_c0_g1~~TRINITY_DN1778_c0_g1_i1.p1  ORF type:complete len:269 (+),score=132.19 TRINITY_DN1778_c0_g1_i1:47-808(+)
MSQPAYKFVVIRHGESVWNQENKFCGWFDADLSDKGNLEAQTAGKTLLKEGYTFDVAYTSLLKRAIKTLFFVQNELDLHWIPVTRDWRLNERMYGALQGLNKTETAEKHGEEQVKIWRRSYAIPPPELEESSPMNPASDPKYKNVPKEKLPKTECLKDTVARVIECWHDKIASDIKEGKKVLVVAHGNSLRALVKYLDNTSEEEILELNIPTGVPLVYELDADLKPIKHYYLGDEEAIKAAVASVANQGKAAK